MVGTSVLHYDGPKYGIFSQLPSNIFMHIATNNHITRKFKIQLWEHQLFITMDQNMELGLDLNPMVFFVFVFLLI